jgi:hypothetical protein
MHDLAIVKTQIRCLLENHPSLSDDDQLRIDVIEGATNALDVVDRLIASIAHAEAMADATREQVEALRTRAGNFDDRAEGLRNVLRGLMDEMRVRKLERPRATVSIRASQPAVIITDGDAIPDEFWRVTKTPARSQIRDALEAGQHVPGATLANGSETLSMRIA